MPRIQNTGLGGLASRPTLFSVIRFTLEYDADDDNWATHGVRYHVLTFDWTSACRFNKHTDDGNVLNFPGL